MHEVHGVQEAAGLTVLGSHCCVYVGIDYDCGEQAQADYQI